MSVSDRNGEGRPHAVRPSGPPVGGRVGRLLGGQQTRLVDLPGLIALWALAVIVFLQFFTRYVLNDSLAWTEEIARYMLILAAFLGAITVTRKGGHIFLEFFYRYLPLAAGKGLAVAMEAVCCLFYGTMAWAAVLLALKTKTKMASAEIPKSLLYWSVAASLALMALFSLLWLYRKLRQRPEEVLEELRQHSFSDLGDEEQAQR